MRRRSLVAPILLIALGALFLANNVRPDLPVSEMLALYWPYLLVVWGGIRLIEVTVAYFRGKPQRGSFSPGEIVLIVFVCLVGSGLFVAHRHGLRFGISGLEMFGDQYDFTISQQHPAGDAKKVIVENLRGNLRITGGDASVLQVTGRKAVRALSRAEAQRAANNSPVEIVTEGDRVVVRTNQERVRRSYRVSEDLELSIPRNVTLEVRGRSGDYDIANITGDVTVAADRADVRISGIGGSARLDVRRSDMVRAVDVKGNLDLEGSGGDIDLDNIAGQVTVSGSYGGSLDFKKLSKPLRFESRNTELRVAALPGRISMDLGDFTARDVVGPMRLVTKSKDVRIQDFSESMEVETDRGDVELQPNRLPLANIDARSRSGRIELVLPPKASFELQATAERGEAVNEFGPQIVKEVEGHSASLRGGTGKGALIRAVTNRGTVAIRKASAVSTNQATL